MAILGIAGKAGLAGIADKRVGVQADIRGTRVTLAKWGYQELVSQGNPDTLEFLDTVGSAVTQAKMESSVQTDIVGTPVIADQVSVDTAAPVPPDTQGIVEIPLLGTPDTVGIQAPVSLVTLGTQALVSPDILGIADWDSRGTVDIRAIAGTPVTQVFLATQGTQALAFQVTLGTVGAA